MVESHSARVSHSKIKHNSKSADQGNEEVPFFPGVKTMIAAWNLIKFLGLISLLKHPAVSWLGGHKKRGAPGGTSL